MVAQQDGHRGHALLLSQLDDRLDGGHGAARAAERAVGNDVDALLLGVIGDVGLGELGVNLELDGSGDDLDRGQKLIDVLLAILQEGVQVSIR